MQYKKEYYTKKVKHFEIHVCFFFLEGILYYCT